MGTTTELTGANLVAGVASANGKETYRAVDPRTGREVGPAFHDATAEEVARATAAGSEAFAVTRALPQDVIAALLQGIAERLEALGDELVETADTESGLGATRLSGERARTCGQLRAFADVVADGGYLDARIDPADPDTQPPRPDLRRMQVPVGPVAVFGASNFPLAFSVPGGDTASALAAGCPVVAKAHPSHPMTSELCARAIIDAVAERDLPAGAFSLVHGRSPDVGRALVLDPQVKAVGFTGSHFAGRALFDLGASRPEPIPVYAEMGSLNPVFVTEAALRARGPQIAEGFVGSVSMGTGQFCTKPGLVFVPDTEAGRTFEQQVAEEAGAANPGPMLNARIHGGLLDQLAVTTRLADVEVLTGDTAAGGDGFTAAPLVLATSAGTFRDTPELAEEHFGPVSIVVRCASVDEMVDVAEELAGSLTATVQGEPTDAEDVRTLEAVLRERAGRLIWNQFPTGVAVTHAMHHGGPYPATTTPSHTSVGSAAIRRFLRPVAYQNMPQELLPPALRDGNPLGIPRLVDGQREA